MDEQNATAQPGEPQLLRPGQPRDEAARASLARYERRVRLPIILSAVLPLVLVPEQGHPVSVVIGIVSWLVFLVDFLVHRRLLDDYTSTRLGKFDLAIVILTAPWFLLPGAQAGGIVVVLRLARLARLVVASRGARQLFERIGRVAIVALSITGVAALVAYYAERPTNPEFGSIGDAFWWAIVTLATVGYGDIVPITPTGRLAGVAIMVTGIAVLGLLAGSLASFFRLDTGAAGPGTARADDDRIDALLSELRDLRAQVDRLSARG